MPDPDAADGRRAGIEADVPADHDEGRHHRHRDAAQEIAALAGVEQQARQHPAEIAGAEIGRRDQQRHEVQLRPEHVGVMVVAEREAGQHAHVLQDGADADAQHHEDDDAPPAIAHRAMEQREQQRNDDGKRQVGRRAEGFRKAVGDDGDERIDRDQQPQYSVAHGHPASEPEVTSAPACRQPRAPRCPPCRSRSPPAPRRCAGRSQAGRW